MVFSCWDAHLESDHLFTFKFATMFHRYSTTFTFPPLKDITKHLFTMYHMFIPFSFTFKSTALHKYLSGSSLSKSPKFLILQFLVKSSKLHSVFRSNELPCGTLITKIKNWICACSVAPEVSIYASNEPPWSTLIVRIKDTKYAHAQ